MKTIYITNARKNLYHIVSDVNLAYNPTTIVNNRGKNAVLISEDDWRNIEETLFLTGIQGFTDDLLKMDKEEDWGNDEVYNPDEEW